MRVLVLLLALLLVPLASAGEGDVVEIYVCVQPAEDERGCHSGISDAFVTVTGAGGTWTGTTLDHGGVRFASLPDGVYKITATHEMTGPGEASFTVPTDRYVEVPVVPDDVRLHGRVVDEDLQPIEGASLLVHGPGTNLTLATDSDGRFDAMVQAGRFWAEVRAPGHLRGWTDGFANGKELRWMLAAAPEGDAVLTGTARDQHGAPVAGAYISAWSYDAHERYEDDHHLFDRYGGNNTIDGYIMVSDPWSRDEVETESGPDGSYELRLPAGEGHLQAWAEGHREAYQDLHLVAGPNTMDLQLWRLPERDARITGRITDAATGAGIGSVSLSVQNVELQEWECSTSEEERPMMHRAGHGGCAITVRPDGTFEGDLMPGYSIISVDGHICDEHDCRQGFIRHVQTRDLPVGTTHLDIEMVPRPAPDAGVSGYVLDAQGQPIRGASISFHNQEMDGFGHASTDQDGSYRVKLRQGWHTINVWAPGHLPWEGMVKAVSGRESPLDVPLKAGEPSCCGHFMGGMRGYPIPMPPIFFGDPEMVSIDNMEHLDEMEYGDGMNASGMERGIATGAGSSDAPLTGGGVETTGGEDFEDLQGGLGPYDPAARKATIEAQQEEAASRGVPGFLLVPALALLVVAWRRR